MIVLLGVALTINALKTVGSKGLTGTLGWLKSTELIRFLKSEAMIRFHAIVVLLFSFVFLNVPRIDFFLCSVLFLLAFITMFYLDDPALLVRMLRVYLAGTAAFVLWFVLGIPAALDAALPYAERLADPGLYSSILRLRVQTGTPSTAAAEAVQNRPDRVARGPV
jgi:hypothetical protein